MERWIAKLIALIGIFVLPLICTLLPIKVHDYFIRKGKRGEELLSWLMCFGGGVFFATYILHMMPEVRLILEQSLIQPYHIDYPLSELIMSFGFFIVLFIEKIALNLHRRRKNAQECAKCPYTNKNAGKEQTSAAENDVITFKNTDVVDIEELDETDERLKLNPCVCKDGKLIEKDGSSEYQGNGDLKATLQYSNSSLHSDVSEEELELEHGSRSLVLVIALSLHRIFEGMSIGLKHTVRGVGSLFLAVLCHEVVIGFSLGLQFVRTKITTKNIIIYTVVCSLIMPIGVAIGTVIVEVGSESQSFDIVNGVLQAVSTGTFIYVTFFEILQGEITHHDTSMGKPIFLLFGFAVMAALSAIPETAETIDEFLGNNTTLSP